MRSITRYTDWPERLSEYLMQAQVKKFEWGRYDCCLFACEAVCVMTGTDLADGFRSYASRQGANRLLKRKGGLRRICETVTKDYGIKEVPVLFARRGDVFLFKTKLGLTLGIVNLNGYEIISVRLRGLAVVPIRDGLRAWRI